MHTILTDKTILWLILCLIIEHGSTDTMLSITKSFSCQNGEYIENGQYCDGYIQCPDGSDEPDICSSTRKSCESGKYHCPTTDSCVEADLLSDVHVQKYCDPNDNEPDSSNDTTPSILTFVSTIESILARDESNSNPKFICDDVRCLIVLHVCHGYCDCFNCSGETSSFPRVGNVSKSEMKDCPSDRFLCGDNKRCLHMQHVCDGYCNCFDCSDEGEDCQKIDHKVLGTCPDFYYPTPLGPRCIYNSSQSDSKNKISKNNGPINCTEKHICDQKCTQFKTKAICSCNDGYIKISNSNTGFRCQSASSSQNALVYSTSSQIKLLNLTTGETSVIKKQIDCKTLTAAHDYIYYTTYSNSSILKYSLTSKKTTEIKLDNSKDSPITSIAVDYITENLYFTTNTTLSVCTNSYNKICTQLKCCNVNYVALAPSYGWMFYTKTYFRPREQYIMRSNMDGSEEIILIDGKFRSIAGLAVDESIGRIYGLAQGKNHIFSVSFYGGNSEYRMAQYEGTAESITALDSRAYYTLTRDREICIIENSEYFTKPIEEKAKIARYRLLEYEPSSLLKIADFFKIHLIEGELTFEVKNLHAYDASQQRNQKAKNPCLGRNKCQGLCLLRSMSSGNDLGYSCPCTDISSGTLLYWCDNSTFHNSPTAASTLWEDVTKEIETPMKKSSTGDKSNAPATSYKSSIVEQSPVEETAQHHTGLEIGCFVALLVLVLCIGYLAVNKWRENYYNNLIFRNSARHCSDNERLHIDQDEL